MYKSFTAADYRKHHDLPKDYTVNGFIIVGTFHPGPYAQLKEELAKFGKNVSYKKVNDNPYFAPILELTIDEKIYWFTIAYGGTMLCEWLHLACLFGSKANILIGQCGGLFTEADTPDIIMPTYAYANESVTRMYEPDASHHHASDKFLTEQLADKIKIEGHKVWQGPTMTCQAMMAETWEDVQKWSNEGYYGVEMEASTIFAVSNHFKRRSAAVLVIGDNLVMQKTVHDESYGDGLDARLKVRGDIIAAVLQEITKD